MAGDDDEMFMTRSLNVTSKTTEQRLVARSDKSVAYVTNNKRLCSTFCTVEATTDRHEASHGLFVTAELPVLVEIHLNETHYRRLTAYIADATGVSPLHRRAN